MTATAHEAEDAGGPRLATFADWTGSPAYKSHALTIMGSVFAPVCTADTIAAFDQGFSVEYAPGKIVLVPAYVPDLFANAFNCKQSDFRSLASGS